ncbi:tRNA1(Val) A37 N6-methylase TrmN6 [Kaistia soli DSM 19436]|uniref:tRNA1(Val) A37 N6-methylase TrmN6 n=1 Tax=Kaistia soli DSM 19436 TaxID=1122133 RepID=A0A1M4VQJ8_9HYPH|nr:methyltransferase [Kaistia soli]SHE71082.1 tRNA1(Val) A37 N6-methylase TrmN6 [Kaistia soli DSM 19436]
MSAATRDAFLGGRVTALQPSAGHHRSGLDAVLLASAFGAETAGQAIDLGAGAGVAGMVLAARAAACSVTLAERESDLVAYAGEAAGLAVNAAFGARLRPLAVDLLDPAARNEAGLAPETFDHALMNPPFHDEGSVRASPKAERARAHVLAGGGLDAWFRAASALVKPRGTLAVILPAARLPDLLDGTADRFGGVAILPIHPRRDEAALRVLARGTKGSRAPLVVLPGLVLHADAGSAFSDAAHAILGDGASLADVHMSWRALAFRP